jgi:NAD(P)-dependent dehydrogenase (short-subunit alcohol dehydrogenase family)
MGPARVALVTGAGRGIGQDVAVALARDGWDVAVLGRGADGLAATLEQVHASGARGLAVTADVRVPNETAAAGGEVEQTLGPIRALVNNAGVQRLSSALDVTESDWDTVFETNLKGAFFCAQAVGRQMVSRGAGAIVNVASAAAVVAMAGRIAYASSKAGMVMMTRALALEWAAHGVRVNAVAPTFVETEMGRLTLELPGMREEIVGRIPMGRLAGVGDVVGAVRFFLDDSASSFLTGQLLAIDGGLTLR